MYTMIKFKHCKETINEYKYNYVFMYKFNNRPIN